MVRKETCDYLKVGLSVWWGVKGCLLSLLLLLLLQLSLKFQDVLFFLSQQAAELLVALSEVSLTRYQGLVALTQLCVQLNTNISRRRSHMWDERGEIRWQQRWDVKGKSKSQIRHSWNGVTWGTIYLNAGMFSYFCTSMKKQDHESEKIRIKDRKKDQCPALWLINSKLLSRALSLYSLNLYIPKITYRIQWGKSAVSGFNHVMGCS